MSRATYNPVVFSRTNTYTNPNESGSSLSSIIHQTDSNGKQKKMDEQKLRTASTGGISKLFVNICNRLGLSEGEAPKPPQSSAQTQAFRPLAPPSVPTATPGTRGHLGPIHPDDQGKKCLVLDLDETLVHSSFRPTVKPDYIIPVEIEGTVHNVYVAKRPGVDEFLRILAQHYEIVIYTASLSKYADPLLDKLDIHNTIRYRLFREHCVRHEGSYVKDLSTLDRDLSQTIIIDNSAMSYVFHPQNAIGCTSFIDDVNDRELISIQNFLLQTKDENDVRDHMYRWTPQGVRIVG